MIPNRLRTTFEKLPESVVFASVSLAVAVYSFIFLYPRQWTRGLLINDEMWYAHLARNLYEGKGFVTNTLYPMQGGAGASFPTPEPLKQAGYSLVSAWTWMVTGPSHKAMLAITIVSFGLVAGMTYLLSRRTGWGRQASLLVTGLVVFNGSVISNVVVATPESLYFVVFLLSIWLVLRPSPLTVSLAGVCHTALLLLKGHGIIYVPIFVLFLLVAARRKRMLLAGTYVTAFVVGMLIASVILPAHSVRLFESGGNYALAFLIGTDRSDASELAYKEVFPPDAVEYILDHPAEYAEKYARMVSRTKFTVDGLSGETLSGVLFPVFLLSMLLLLLESLLPGRLLPADVRPATEAGREEPDSRWVYLFFAAMIIISFLFFWAIHLRVRYLVHIYPLMLLIIFWVIYRLRPSLPSVRVELRTALAALAVLYVVVYPGCLTLLQAYRDPFVFIGRNLAVRFADYGEVSETVKTYVAPDAVVISDMAHEINWLTGTNTMDFPLSEEGLRFLVAEYDVQFLYEHPNKNRIWPWIPTVFRLVDEENGRFWVRRDGARRIQGIEP